MTIVVAIECDGAVVIGCDSSVVAGDAREVLDGPKWWVSRGVIVGYAGDLRAALLVKTMHARMRAPSALRHEALTYVERLAMRTRKLLRGARVAQGELSLLVAFSGCAWVVEGGTVVRSVHGYAAIGSGAQYALGSLASTEGRGVEERATIAVQAAARHSSSCCLPVRITIHSAETAREGSQS